jgi:membrane fusion protein, multidrug efflux system
MATPEQSQPKQPVSEHPPPRDDHGAAPMPVYPPMRDNEFTMVRESAGLRIGSRILGMLIVVGAIVLGLYVSRLYYVYPRTDDAYVRANVIGIAAHVSGPIVEMPIEDNQHVKAGQLLFVVDPRPYQSAVDKAEADLALTNLQIKALSDTIASARARQQALEADMAYDKQYLNRIEPLLGRHFVTANDVFNARSRLAAAEASVASSQSEVSKAQNDLGQYGDINARRQAAEAALYDAKLNLGYCKVAAPFDAYVTNLNIAIGQYANEGHEVLSLVDNRNWYVLANFRENFLGHIRPGMDARVYLLSYPNKRFSGRVQGVGWALYQNNGASVQGLPQVEETLNWVRLSERFPVRIVLDAAEDDFPFRMGETAVVTIQGNRQGNHQGNHTDDRAP